MVTLRLPLEKPHTLETSSPKASCVHSENLMLPLRKPLVGNYYFEPVMGPEIIITQRQRKYLYDYAKEKSSKKHFRTTSH